MKPILPKQIPFEVLGEFLTTAYHLSNIQITGIFEEGVENGAWPIRCDQGQFVCKVFAATKEMKFEAQKEAVLVSYLLAQNIHVPRFLLDGNGKEVLRLRFKNNDYPVIVMYLECLRRVF